VLFLLAAAAAGCFDFAAAGRCFGQPEGTCERDATTDVPGPAGDAGVEAGGDSTCSGLAVLLCDGFEGSVLSDVLTCTGSSACACASA
jgi:hypothetical protein